MEITYQYLWDHMTIGSPNVAARRGYNITEADIRNTAEDIMLHADRYKAVVTGTRIPWQFIGVTHYRESSLSFKKHPHNGDPLTARTIHVPAGRPKGSIPPFTWEESARDCYITLKSLDIIATWDIETILIQLERFNGLGYRQYHSDVLSPYLWSGTGYYMMGKYASDGKFDNDLIDKQIGTAPLFKYLTDKKLGLVTS